MDNLNQEFSTSKNKFLEKRKFVLFGVIFSIFLVGVLVFSFINLGGSNKDLENKISKKEKLPKQYQFEKVETLEYAEPVEEFSYQLIISDQMDFSLFQGFGARKGAKVNLSILNSTKDKYLVPEIEGFNIKKEELLPNSSTTLVFNIPNNFKKEFLSFILENTSTSSKNVEVRIFAGD